VLAPAACALLAAIADDGAPVAVGLVLIVGGDLKREGLVVLEHGTAVEPHARDTRNRELDRQHVARFAGWVITGRTMDRPHRTVGKGCGVEAGSSFGVLIVPETNRVLGHCMSFPHGARQRIRARAASSTCRMTS